MLVFGRDGLVLLAVPKTGTTALEEALAPRATLLVRDPPQLKHSTYRRYRRFILPFIGRSPEPEVIAVVREPLSWLGSWYRYRGRDDLVGHANSTREISFDTFVDQYCRGSRPAYAEVGSQAAMVQPPEGAPPVSRLFRYEQMPRLLGFFEERLHLRLDVPRRNVSPEGDLSLSPRIRAKLERKCAAEFELWHSAGA